MKPIIVMAGTPVDTRMGMDCLSSHGLTGLFCPVSENPNQQTAFQISPMEKKARRSRLCCGRRRRSMAVEKPLSTAIPCPAPWISAPLRRKPA